MKKTSLVHLATSLVVFSIAVLLGNVGKTTSRTIASPLNIAQNQVVDDSLLPLLIIDAQGEDHYFIRPSFPPLISPDGGPPQVLPPRRIPDPAEVRSVRVSPTGQFIASGDDENEIQLWDITTGEALHTWLDDRSEGTQAVEFTPDGNTVVAGGVVAGQLRQWQWQDNSRLVQNSPLNNIYSVDISPDGELIATGHSGGEIKLWNRDLELIRSIQAYPPSSQGSTPNVVAVEFDPRGMRLASRSFGGAVSIQIIEIATGRIVKTLSGDGSGGVDSIAYSPDGEILAGCHYDGTYEAGMVIRLWNPRTGVVIADFQTDIVRPHAIAFSSDGEFIAIAGLSDRIEVWSVQNQEIVQTFTSGLDFHHVYSIDFVPDSRTFVTSGVATLQDADGIAQQGTIMTWELPTLELN